MRGLVSSVLVALVIGSPAARACSCAPESIETLVERSDLAVQAKPIVDAPFDLRRHDPGMAGRPPRTVTLFEVERVLRGVPVPERIAVLHRLDSGACGIRFLPEHRYLLAFRMPEADAPAPLWIGLCRVRILGSEGSASRGGSELGGPEPRRSLEPEPECGEPGCGQAPKTE